MDGNPNQFFYIPFLVVFCCDVYSQDAGLSAENFDCTNRTFLPFRKDSQSHILVFMIFL